MSKRVAMIFLVFSLVMTGVSIWCVATWENSVRREVAVEFPDFPEDETSCVETDIFDMGFRGHVLLGSATVGPWIVLLAVSCLGLGMLKKKGA